MLETIAALISVFGAMFTGYATGYLHADGKSRRANAVVARCAGCEWSSGPVTVAAAFTAADRHTVAPDHRGIVVLP